MVYLCVYAEKLSRSSRIHYLRYSRYQLCYARHRLIHARTTLQTDYNFVISVDICSSSPCLNGGSCAVNRHTGHFDCKCLPGASDPYCKSKDACAITNILYKKRRKYSLTPSKTLSLCQPNQFGPVPKHPGPSLER